jgi:hypothetical protein
MTFYTYREAVGRYGSRSAVMGKVSAGALYLLRRNLYSTKKHTDPLEQVMKLYPRSVVTGFTAFYIHGLTDKVPGKIDLATQRNATRITDPEIRQHFVANDLLDVGVTVIDYDGTKVKTYDLEAMLFYLMHNDGKLPFDLYKEVVTSCRRRAGELDYQRLQRYSNILPGGRKNLERMITEVL